MFGFFIGDTFKGFWANKPGDIFYDLTLQGMGWQDAELYYYPNFKYGEADSLDMTKSRAISKDENENILMEVEAVPYVVNGEKLKEC